MQRQWFATDLTLLRQMHLPRCFLWQSSVTRNFAPGPPVLCFRIAYHLPFLSSMGLSLSQYSSIFLFRPSLRLFPKFAEFFAPLDCFISGCLTADLTLTRNREMQMVA